MAIFYTTPTPLEEAIVNISAETPVGSILRTPDWAALPDQLRHTAFFSAAIENVNYLAEAQERILDYVKLAREQLAANNKEGEPATALPDPSAFATALRQLGGELGAPRTVFPSYEGSLVEPLCAQRLRLITDFRVQSALAYAEWKAGQDPDLLDAFPAQELISLEERTTPPAWQTRWAEAGGKLYRGRMIARKDAPIWHMISRFGGPLTPLDLYSGIGIKDIDRFEAEGLGVITPEDQVQPSDGAFTANLDASIESLPPHFIQALDNLFGDQIEIEDNTAKWVPRDAVANSGRWDYRWGKGDSRGGRFRAKDGGGSVGGGAPHPIERATRIHPEDAARLLLAHPNHPTTRAFSDYINNGPESISVAQQKRIDEFLRRMPPYRPETPLYRGLSKESAERRDEMLSGYLPGSTITMDEYITSGSKDLRVAMSFARKKGHGMVLAALTVRDSVRDVEPIAKALSHKYLHQREVMFLRGSSFLVKGQRSVAGLPVPILEEVSS